MKIKYNTTIIKWLTAILFLMFNICLFGLKSENSDNNDKIFAIVFLSITNSLAVISFIMLTFFPRLYYVFDENGCSFENRKGKKYIEIQWQDVLNNSFGYFVFIPAGLTITWKENCNKRNISFNISSKQAKQVYEAIPQVKAIMDKK